MKTRIFFLTVLMYFFSQAALSQSIDSLTLNPANPSDTDNVEIIATTTFPNSPCDMLTSSVSVQGNSITIDVEHTSGMMPAICNSTDTLTIGTLNPGTYKLTYKLNSPNTSVVFDTSSLSFTVKGSNQQSPEIDSLRIIPNNPTNQDSTKIISSVSFPNSDCYMTSFSANVSNDSIFMDAYHKNGQIQSACNSIDTLDIGKLNPNSYELFYHMLDSANSDTLDTDTISFTVQQSNQQAGKIDSLNLMPDNPTNQDTVHIISSTTFQNSACYMTDFSSTISNDSVFIDAYHIAGQYPAICNTMDTINIGKLNAGTYELFYNLLDSATADTFDVDTLNFMVQDVSGIESLTPGQQIDIYPNPANHKITINLKDLPMRSHTIDLYAATGQKIRTLTTHDKKITMDISTLDNGIYLVIITDKLGNQQSRKIIITDINH